MDSENSSGNIAPGVDDYIQFAGSLKLRCHKLEPAHGVSKLQRKIQAEIKFLNSLKIKDLVTQKNHMKSSNLSHFSSLVDASERLPGVVQVLQPFAMPARTDSLIVDVVAGGGHVWVKVIARKAQALHLVWAGQGQFGERDLLSQAEDYLACAALHPFQFRTPQIHFAFYNQVTKPMAECLKKMGVFVWGEVVPVKEDVQAKLKSSFDESPQQYEDDDYSDVECGHIKEEGRATFSNTLNGSPHDTESTTLQPSLLSPLETIHTTDSIVQSKPDPVGDSLYCKNDDSTYGSPTYQTHYTIACSDDPLTSADSNNSYKIYEKLFLRLVSSPPDYSWNMTSAATVDKSISPITRANLDITTLIAMVSSVTNGNCHYVFRDKVLSEQAQEERTSPVLPVIENFLKGKEIFACETAVSSFQSILDILGGPAEKRRASELLKCVHVVPDQPSQRASALRCQGRVKERSKIVFGTGDSLQAVTVTSNMGFARAAESQGIVFSVFLHAARALTEEKEHLAVPLLQEKHQTASANK